MEVWKHKDLTEAEAAALLPGVPSECCSFGVSAGACRVAPVAGVMLSVLVSGTHHGEAFCRCHLSRVKGTGPFLNWERLEALEKALQ